MGNGYSTRFSGERLEAQADLERVFGGSPCVRGGRDFPVEAIAKDGASPSLPGNQAALELS